MSAGESLGTSMVYSSQRSMLSGAKRTHLLLRVAKILVKQLHTIHSTSQMTPRVVMSSWPKHANERFGNLKKTVIINLNEIFLWAFYINLIEYIIFLIYIRFKCSQEYKAIDKEVLSQLVQEGSANGKKILQNPQVVRAHSGRIKGLFLYSVNKGSQESYSGLRMQIRQI